jgi:hypothetical protein
MKLWANINIDGKNSTQEVYLARDYDALAAELAEAKLQRDSWKRIAESGLGLTAETKGEAGDV